MNREDFQKLVEFTKDKFNINESNIMEKSLLLFSSYNYYNDLYIHELRILKKKLIEKESIYGEVYQAFRTGKMNLELKHKTEIDPFINSNAVYKNICLEIIDQEMVVRYLEETLDIIKKSSYHINNIITLIKLKNGIE